MSLAIWCKECRCDHWIEVEGCIDRGYKNLIKHQERLEKVVKVAKELNRIYSMYWPELGKALKELEKTNEKDL